MGRSGSILQYNFCRCPVPQIKKKMMEEFDKEARVMDIKIANIIEKGRSNYTQFTGPLTDQTPFPAAVAAEFAYLAEDEAAFYEELGGKVHPALQGVTRAKVKSDFGMREAVC